MKKIKSIKLKFKISNELNNGQRFSCIFIFMNEI